MERHDALPLIRPIRPAPLRSVGILGDLPAWSVEPKYDGYRGLFYKSHEECWFVGKRGQKLESRFAPLAHEVAAAFKPQSLVLDGELVAVGKGNLPALKELRSKWATLVYVAFDLLWQDGKDVRHLPLRERRQKLDRLVPDDSPFVTQAPFAEYAEMDAFIGRMQKLQIEGIVLKRPASSYTRRTLWYKVKKEYMAAA